MHSERLEELTRAVREGRLSRRDFLLITGGAIGAASLAGCAPAATPTPAPPPAEAPAAPVGGLPPVEVRQNIPPPALVDCAQWKKPPPWKVAFASQGPTNSWALMMDAHAEYAVKEKYKDLFSDYFYADSKGSADKQVTDIEDLTAMGPDIMVVCAIGQAITANVEKAWDLGIPVVLCSGMIDTEKYVTFVDADNYECGWEFAQYLAGKLDYKGEVVLLSGIAGSDTAEKRADGAKAAFALYPDIEILDHHYCDWSITKAKETMEAVLTAHPDLVGVWSDSAFHAWPTVEAYLEAGKTPGPQTTEPLNGFLRLAKENNIPFFARGYPNAVGLYCMDAAVRVMMGERVSSYIPIEVVRFEDDEVDKYYRPDLPDDAWVDYILPSEYMDKLFK